MSVAHRHSVVFFAPTPQPSTRPEADSVGRSGLGGHARGMALLPLAPRSGNLVPPSDAAPTFPPHDADHHGWHGASAIRAPAPVAQNASPCPAVTLWPSTAHPSQEREGIEERRRSAEAARRRRCHRSGGRRLDPPRRRCSALHGFISTRPRPATAPPSFRHRHRR